ncbi:hypothetical protein [Vibrio fluminensis]|uniref:hypothetical protein n=1 Tax=Vibrio fluminensis TaxID=2783614 RepID=UPI001889C300|nr:hypothetical protein [Vibrio fluminensis]
MKRKNSFFNAHRIKTILLFLIVNVVLLVLYQFSVVEFYGTVERPHVAWSSYTQFHNKDIETQVVISRKADDYIKSLSYDYHLSKSKGGEYIVTGGSNPEPVRHTRVFYLDEQCSLVFSNFTEMIVNKVALRCLY